MLSLLFLFLASGLSLATEFTISSTGGAMQQPSSQYYAAVYGGMIDFANDSNSMILRTQYLQRPKYSAVGFEDQDIAYFGLLGTKITKSKAHGLYTYFGGGTVQGYVKDTSSGEKSTYSMSGMALTIEYAAKLGPLTASASHSLLSGYADDDQFQAYVVWPYNFFLINIGMRVSGP